MSSHRASLSGNVLKIAGYQHQADAAISQANPVSTTLYTVLDTTRNVRIISIHLTVTWTVQPNPLDAIVIIDGQTLTWTFANPASTTDYTALNDARGVPTAIPLVANSPGDKPFLLEGRSVSISARTTGGTVQNLSCRVKYAKIP